MRDKVSNSLWGLFFIVIGIGFAGNVLNLWDFQLFFPGWWTLLIIIPCFISMIQTGFGVGSTMGFIIGVLLFISYRIDLNFSIWKLVVPVILIFVGIRIMFQGAFRKGPKFNANADGSGRSFTGAAHSDYSAVFSSNTIHVTEVFNGTNLNAIFGGVVLDLRNAIINGDVEINATAVFGGIDIFLPNGVKIKSNNVPIFGGVTNKATQSSDPNAPTIYLNSTCMFGGIDIK
ncbi:MAG: LiaF domain-containing protein [Mobilitalea sp.]